MAATPAPAWPALVGAAALLLELLLAELLAELAELLADLALELAELALLVADLATLEEELDAALEEVELLRRKVRHLFGPRVMLRGQDDAVEKALG